MNLARFAVARAQSSVAAATGGAVLDCPKFAATLMLFDAFASSSPTSGSLREVSSETIPAFNVREEPILAGQEVFLSQTVDEIWIVECIY
jgi:hypothetical protein